MGAEEGGEEGGEGGGHRQVFRCLATGAPFFSDRGGSRRALLSPLGGVLPQGRRRPQRCEHAEHGVIEIAGSDGAVAAGRRLGDETQKAISLVGIMAWLIGKGKGRGRGILERGTA